MPCHFPVDIEDKSLYPLGRIKSAIAVKIDPPVDLAGSGRINLDRRRLTRHQGRQKTDPVVVVAIGVGIVAISAGRRLPIGIDIDGSAQVKSLKGAVPWAVIRPRRAVRIGGVA
jgi:hypothetical protein